MKKAFLDIETTGLNPLRHQVLEVAYIREDEDGCVLEGGTTHFSLPIAEARADKDALRINKYHARKGELADILLSEPVACGKLLSELEDYMIVGANPAFDTAFLRAFLWNQFDCEPSWYYRTLDLNTFASGWLHNPGVLKTPAVAAQFRVPFTDERHTALADAKWNRQIYHAIVNSG